jgi:hypothetical protein
MALRLSVYLGGFSVYLSIFYPNRLHRRTAPARCERAIGSFS